MGAGVGFAMMNAAAVVANSLLLHFWYTANSAKENRMPRTQHELLDQLIIFRWDYSFPWWPGVV